MLYEDVQQHNACGNLCLVSIFLSGKMRIQRERGFLFSFSHQYVTISETLC